MLCFLWTFYRLKGVSGIKEKLRSRGPATVAKILVSLAVSSCASATTGRGEEGSELEALIGEGRGVFLELSEPGCGLCHAMRDAGTTGALGPDLDDLRPDFQRVLSAVTGGVGVMPAQEHLTERQLRALATYVSQIAGALD